MLNINWKCKKKRRQVKINKIPIITRMEMDLKIRWRRKLKLLSRKLSMLSSRNNINQLKGHWTLKVANKLLQFHPTAGLTIVHQEATLLHKPGAPPAPAPHGNLAPAPAKPPPLGWAVPTPKKLNSKHKSHLLWKKEIKKTIIPTLKILGQAILLQVQIPILPPLLQPRKEHSTKRC